MPTAVLIPGLISDSRVWRPLADSLATSMDIHAADLSQMTGITQAAEQLLELNGSDLVIAGHSMGGRIALEMARIAPDRVKGLILANTGHGPKSDGEEVPRQKKIDLGHESMGKLADEWLPPMVGAPMRDDAAFMANLREMVLKSDGDMHERQIRALIDRPDAGAYLDRIACPVLVIAADGDGWSPVAQHEQIAAGLKDAELYVVQNAGHFAPLEQPGQICTTVTDWIARKGLNA